MTKFTEFLNEKKNEDVMARDIIDIATDVLDYNIGITNKDLVISEYIYEVDEKQVFIGSSDGEYNEKELKAAFEKNKGVEVLSLKFKSYMISDEAFIDIKMRIKVKVK